MDKVKKYFDLAKKQELPLSLNEANKMIDSFNGFSKGKLNINIKKLIIMTSTFISILILGFIITGPLENYISKDRQGVDNIKSIPTVKLNRERRTLSENNKPITIKTITLKPMNNRAYREREDMDYMVLKNNPPLYNNINPLNIKAVNYKSAYLNPINKGIYDTIIVKEYTVSKEKGISLEDIYSNVRIKVWNESKIKVVASFIITAKEKNKRVFLDNIDLALYRRNKSIVIDDNFFNFPQFLASGTMILHNGKQESYKYKRIKKFEFENGVRSNIDFVHIDYVIFVPQNFNIDLSIRNGNIEIEKINSRIKIFQDNGELTINQTNNNLKLDLENVKATIKSFKNGEFFIFKSNVKFNTCELLNIETFYKSKMEFNSCNSLNIDYCNNSEIKALAVVDSLNFSSHKSHVNIDECGVSTAYTDHSQLIFNKVKMLKLIGHKDSVSINKIDKLNIQTEHSQFYIKNAGSINIESEKTTYSINKADSITAYLKKGVLSVDNLNYLETNYTHKEDFIIHQLSTLKGSVTHSSIKIDLLQKNADFESFKDVITIGIADNKFKKLKFNLEKSNFTILKEDALVLPFKLVIYDKRINKYGFDSSIEDANYKENGRTIFKSKNFENTKLGKVNITSSKSIIKIGNNKIK